MTRHRSLIRLCAPPATLAAAATLSLCFALPAAAHVSITATTTVVGEYSVLTVSVPHGCDGSATTRVEVQLPEEILSVTPTRNPFWTLATKTVRLDKPVTDAHGNTVTERMGSVVYTATTSLPEGQRDTFELSLKLPDAEGPLSFPTVQTCERGEVAWIEVPAGGQSADELDHPAPTISLASGPAPGAEESAHKDVPAAQLTSAEADAGTGADADAGSDTGQNATTLAALGVGAGLLGLVTGGVALTRARRRT